MLFNVLFAAMGVYIMVCTPVFLYKAVRFGMSIAAEEEDEFKVFNIPKKTKQPKMTPEESRRQQILDNINKYDGTSNGQKKVKKVE